MKSEPGRCQVGDKIDNRFQIYQILEGGMGIVYICYDYKSKMPFALKTCQERFLLSKQAQEIFKKEALLWTELERFPYIVRANWVEKLEGRLFIVLEYIVPDGEGRNTLTHYLKNLTYSDILKFSIQFCYGMEHAYSRGIDSHRDIKPDNIMITSDKTAKITDFGLAKVFSEIEFKKDNGPGDGRTGLSIFINKGKRVCGTLPWMSPEQFDGFADQRSDIYSFGIVMYQMAARGMLPFKGNNLHEYENLHKYGEITFFSHPLFAIIKKCLEKEPDKRFQNFAYIRENLQDFLIKETGEKIKPLLNVELDAWELSNKGIALSNLGKYDEAISCIDRALEINPNLAETWMNKGITLGTIGKYDNAISCIDKALKINVKLPSAWHNKGLVLYDLKRYEEAISCYDNALEINPTDALAWNNKGLALVALGRYDEAISCYDKALEISPNLFEAWTNVGLTLVDFGRYDEAILCFDKALEVNPGEAKAWSNKGAALIILNRYNEAISCIDKALEINPAFPQAHQLKQLILQSTGR